VPCPHLVVANTEVGGKHYVRALSAMKSCDGDHQLVPSATNSSVQLSNATWAAALLRILYSSTRYRGAVDDQTDQATNEYDRNRVPDSAFIRATGSCVASVARGSIHMREQRLGTRFADRKATFVEAAQAGHSLG